MPSVQQEFSNATCATTLGSSWVERNQALEDELRFQAPELFVDLDRTTKRLDYTIHNLNHRPTIGLFGASQAGKSYLVSTLAAGANGKLTTHWDKELINFIRHVNPSGNNSEATGFATRFTHEAQPTPEGFPVALKVLSEMELAMILVNAFFADINQSDVTVPSDESFFLAHLKKLESLVDTAAQQKFFAYPQALMDKLNATAAAASNGADTDTDSANSALQVSNSDIEQFFRAGRTVTVNGVTERNYLQPADISELADYVSTNSTGKIGGLERMPNFWLKLRNMLPFMTLDGRVQALSVLWQELPIFNETFRTLAHELLKLEGHDTIFAPLGAFVTGSGESLVQNATGTIMHITMLATMFSDTSTLTCALTGPSDSASIGGAVIATPEVNVSRLAALSLELSFHLEDSGSLDAFDVLDLPGARSRDVVQLKDVISDGAAYKQGEALSDAMQLRGSEFFRRGKVGYLFERYARRNEIEQLLFCIGVNAQQDVTTVLTILSDWVEKNVGETPQKRAQSHNPLTIVLTRYDEVFNRQLRNLQNALPLDMNQELNIALNRIQKLNWFNEWTPGKPFDRVLLARKPNLGELNPWLESEPQTNKELAIRPDCVEAIAQIKVQLMAVTDFQLHIANMEQALEEVLALNDGGVSRISAHIKEHSLTDAERQSSRTYKAQAALGECLNLLQPFATRDSAIALEKAKVEAKKLTLGLMQCNAIAPCLDLIRSLMDVEEERLEIIYQHGFSTGSNVRRFVQEVCNYYLENVSLLSRRDNKKVAAIAELIANGYKQVQKNLMADPNSVAYFSLCYDPTEQRFKTPEEFKDDVIFLLNNFYKEVAKTFSSPQIGLKNYMTQMLLRQENINEGFVDIVRVQVQIMSTILSDFNLYLGANLLPNSAAKAALAQSQAQASAAATLSAAAQGAPIPVAPAPASTAVAGAASAVGAPSYGDADPYQAASPAAPAGGYGGGMAFGDEGMEDDFSDLVGTADENDYGAYSPVSPAPAASAAPAAPAAAPYAAAAAANPADAAAAQAGFRTQTVAYTARPNAAINASGVGLQQLISVEQSVLGTTEGPLNHFSHQQSKISYHEGGGRAVFAPFTQVDDTNILPHLDADSADYEFHFISDYMSTLMFMMCQINVLAQSKFKFPAQENLLLCQILATMEACQ